MECFAPSNLRLMDAPKPFGDEGEPPELLSDVLSVKTSSNAATGLPLIVSKFDARCSIRLGFR
jgi:hypothetical protein